MSRPPRPKATPLGPGCSYVDGGPDALLAYLKRTPGTTFATELMIDGALSPDTVIHCGGKFAIVDTGMAYELAKKLIPNDKAQLQTIRNITLSRLAEQAGMAGHA